MVKRLFIAEKPDAGKQLANYLAKKAGITPVPGRHHVVVGSDTVAWLRGHVLGLVKPEKYDPRYKQWSAPDLPIVPPQFQLEPIESNKDFLDSVRTHLKSCDEVVLFTDAEARGELIGRQCLYFLGNKKPVYRLWTSGLNNAALDKAMAELKPWEHYNGYYFSALAQDHADWLYGINMSRACGIAARARGLSSTISVGRVQTPTLAIVVWLEQKIRNFKPVDHYTPWLKLSTDPIFTAKWKVAEDDARLNPEGLLVDKAIADGIQAKSIASGIATVLNVETTKAKENPPLPFSLTTLQVFADKHFGLGAKESLDVAQSLYDKKLTSYPRVSTEYLREDMHPDATNVLTSLAKAPLPTSFNHALRGAKPELKSPAWNDSKLSDHHGIIPLQLDNPRDVDTLSEIEKKVYYEIVRRYVLQFWPPAQYQRTVVTLDCEGETFTSSGKRYTDDGWRKAFAAPGKAETTTDDADGDQDELSQKLPHLTVGQVVKISEAGYDSRRTEPPKRFTEGTLLAAMEKCHKYVTDPKIRERLKEHAGIGTVATRPAIINGLMSPDRQFMAKSGKFIVPTELGETLISILPLTMTAPDMTAMWGMFTDEILAGRATYEAFIQKQITWLQTMVKSAAQFFEKIDFSTIPGQAAAAKAKAVVIETEESCTCGSKLKRINGKYGWFWACSSEACKKTYRDVDGKPAEKTPAALGHKIETGICCPRCKKGTLRAISRRDGSGKFWGCSEYQAGCKATFNDLNGAPDLAPKVAA